MDPQEKLLKQMEAYMFSCGFCTICSSQLSSEVVSVPGFSAGTLVAGGLCGYKSFWIIQTHVFGRCGICAVQLSRVQILTSKAMHWQEAMAPPLASSWGTSPFIYVRCVAFITWLWTWKDLGVQLTLWRLAGFQSQCALKLSTWGCVSRALVVSFE